MAEVLVPKWADLESLIASARERVLIVAPFYSEEGVTRVLDSLEPKVAVWVRTRLSPPDWAAGVADPRALYALLDLLPGQHDLGIVQQLHAKAYFADGHIGLIGSSNLSENGFSRQVELVVRMGGDEAAAALAAVLAACSSAKPMSIDDLAAWIDRWQPLIDETRQKTPDVAEALAPAQQDLDELLGFGGAGEILSDPGPDGLDAFVEWLGRNPDLAGAQMLLSRHYNLEGQNLQGHVKQSYFAVTRFLEERPELVPLLSERLSELELDDVYTVDEPVAEAWLEHTNAHATDEGEGWSYAILRGLMPPGLGGTRLGGGGGSSTLKRMFPLVASYLRDRDGQ